MILLWKTINFYIDVESQKQEREYRIQYQLYILYIFCVSFYVYSLSKSVCYIVYSMFFVFTILDTLDELKGSLRR